MKPNQLLQVIIVSLTLAVANVWADGNQLLIITHSQTQTQWVDKKSIKRIYMESANRLKAINLPKNNKARAIFNTKIIGLTESRISSYWAQMKFTGRGTPPMVLESDIEAMAFIQKNPGYIAYINSRDELPDNVRVIHTIKY